MEIVAWALALIFIGMSLCLILDHWEVLCAYVCMLLVFVGGPISIVWLLT